MTTRHEKKFFKDLNKTIKVRLDPSLSDDEAIAVHKKIEALKGVKKLGFNIQAHVDPSEAEDPGVLYKGLKKHTREIMIDMFGPSKRLKHEFDAIARREKLVDQLVDQITRIDGVIEAHVMHKGPFRGWVPVTEGPKPPAPKPKP